MRPVRSLLLFVLVVFIGGALLAPWLYWLAQAAAPNSALAHSPFHRYVHRAMLGLALIGIWPLLRGLGAKSPRDAGLVKPAGQWHRLFAGFVLGFGSLACVAAIVLAAHGRAFNDALTGSELARGLAAAALSAIVVAILEEILFRGAIFGGLRRIWNWRFALLVSAMIYAIVHFMKRAEVAPPITWTSGLSLLPLMLAGFDDWQAVIPGFLNLTLAGILLGLAYQRTGNLYFSIGLHAGWIFWLKSYGMLTSSVLGADIWFWGTGNLIDGWLALIVLAATLAILVRSLPKKSQ